MSFELLACPRGLLAWVLRQKYTSFLLFETDNHNYFEYCDRKALTCLFSFITNGYISAEKVVFLQS